MIGISYFRPILFLLIDIIFRPIFVEMPIKFYWMRDAIMIVDNNNRPVDTFMGLMKAALVHTQRSILDAGK